MIFRELIYLEHIDSTNSYLKKVEKNDRVLVWTYNQTEGRGRENRRWIDFKDKNLALSVLFLPEEPINILWYIATISLSLIDTLDSYGIKDRWIKWPNDVYILDKKLAGILAESVWSGDKIERLIIGIGVNVNTTEEDLTLIDKKATSIAIEIKKSVDIKEWTKNFITNISNRFELFLIEKNIKKIKEDWLKESKIIEKLVEWRDINREIPITGIVKDIDIDGFLVLQTKDKIFKVTSGDIILKN